MILHIVVEQADMKSALHASGTLLVGTLIPYPLFLFGLTKSALILLNTNIQPFNFRNPTFVANIDQFDLIIHS